MSIKGMPLTGQMQQKESSRQMLTTGCLAAKVENVGRLKVSTTVVNAEVIGAKTKKVA